MLDMVAIEPQHDRVVADLDRAQLRQVSTGPASAPERDSIGG
jgi:hypothetical protein